MDTPVTAPILSTPAEHVFEETVPAALPSSESRISEEQLYIQYEIKRTIAEIRQGRWKRIALQFPDQMLVDAPRVFERLRDGLKAQRMKTKQIENGSVDGDGRDIAERLYKTGLTEDKMREAREEDGQDSDVEERLCILADTSYGSCCVDEIAAEHVDAEIVVHYGRACLSPTARLPVIYIFTSPPLDLEAAIASFKELYWEKGEKVCLMADIPYHHHIPLLHQRLRDEEGYENVYATEVVRDPSSLLPNRTIPQSAKEDAERLKEYSVFHISTPPTSLLLILSSRVKRIHIFPTTKPTSSPSQPTTTPATITTTNALIRRRYAHLTLLPTIPILGILINTLSVYNYTSAITHIQNLIRKAGKKSYLFVVGKVNAAKIANFAEIGAWIVVGCWESSLIENKEFYAPVVTPFELEVALRGEAGRVWGGEWIADFASLLGKEDDGNAEGVGGDGDSQNDGEGARRGAEGTRNWDDEPSDDEPPDFDLRTGRYVSHTRPMGRIKRDNSLNGTPAPELAAPAPPSSALIQRAKGDIATINGAVSPGAEFLRSKRTWKGLGSDYDLGEIAYERDGDGKIRGAAMEEGRSGIAKGYGVGGEEEG